MKTEPIVQAHIEFEPGQPPRSPAFGDIYHPRAGALEQARHVFLGGNALPQRWQGRDRFVVLETGFGLGNNFLATWSAWREDPSRCERLFFVSIDKHPPSREDLARAHADSTLAELAAELNRQWPPLTPNLHLLDFEGGRVRLLLALGDVRRLLPQLQLQADAFFLDGFAPDRNPQMWTRHVVAALTRKAAPQATAATWSVARELRASLQASGFEVSLAPGFGGKREITTARFAPHFAPRRAPARHAFEATTTGSSREALIIGAGLAGAFAADAMRRQGWACTVLDRHAQPAQEASGNPAGLYHGTAHAEDGNHARFTRAAALLAGRRHAQAIRSGAVSGQSDGLLRMRPSLDAPGLPSAYVQHLSPFEAAAASGLPLDEAAWLYPAGGWLAPAQLCQWLLGQPGIRFLGGQATASLRHAGGLWTALDATGSALASARVLILATGAAALPVPGQPLPWTRVRGQVSWTGEAGPVPLRHPLSGHGYALSLRDGRWLFGATTQAGDEDASLRADDHQVNRQRLSELIGVTLDADMPLQGRVAWRAVAPDRLPLIGAMPANLASLGSRQRLDQCRLVPRIPGLFVLLGLASRGLTWGPLAGEVLASWITGAPMPLEADLLDAVDPARFAVRQARRPGRTETDSV